MEKTRKPFSFGKILLIALAALLAYNFFQTRKNTKELQNMEEDATVTTPGFDLNGATDAEKIAQLTQVVTQLQAQVEAQHQEIENLKSVLANSPSATASTSNSASNTSSGYTFPTTGTSSNGSSGRVNVATNVWVANRSVYGETVLPKVTTAPEGVVVIGVTVNAVGSVTSATVKSGTTISDENVVNECRQAALQTRFAINVDATNGSSGTISYTFTRR